MRIVKRPEFKAMPAGTLYSHFEPCVFGDLQIKGETIGNDWYYQNIIDAIENNGSDQFADKLLDSAEHGTSMPMDFYMEGRDGCFDPPETMYAVWERADVEALIERLRATFSASAVPMGQNPER